MYGIKFIFAMAGIGVLIGITLVLACLLITLVAAHPWLTILLIGILYGIMGALIEAKVI